MSRILAEAFKRLHESNSYCKYPAKTLSARNGRRTGGTASATAGSSGSRVLARYAVMSKNWAETLKLPINASAKKSGILGKRSENHLVGAAGRSRNDSAPSIRAAARGRFHCSQWSLRFRWTRYRPYCARGMCAADLTVGDGNRDHAAVCKLQDQSAIDQRR